MSYRRPASLVAVLVLNACTTSGMSDEAILIDGRAIDGKLTKASGEPLQFISKAKSVPLAEVERIRFAADVSTFRAGALHQVTLANDQQLCGELLTLDAQALRLRTAWRDKILIPRQLIVSVAHVAGLITLHDEDFEARLTGWKLTGAALTAERQTSGKKSLRLSSGQAAEFVLPQPLDAGAAGINFHLPDDLAGLRCWLEASFLPRTRGPSVQRVKVALTDAGAHYVVDTEFASEEVDALRRAPGWHRLALRFHERYLLIAVDGQVIFSSKDSGTLTRLRLRCEAVDGQAPRGAVCFDDLTIARRVESRSHPAGDPKQDELWLLDGNQLFGSVVSADRRRIQFRGRFGERTFPWSEVRGMYLSRPHAPREEPQAEREVYYARVTFHSSCGQQLDELDGAVLSFDEQRLTLRHAELGKLDIDRARITQIRLRK